MFFNKTIAKKKPDFKCYVVSQNAAVFYEILQSKMLYYKTAYFLLSICSVTQKK